jgi:hypothetical protein
VAHPKSLPRQHIKQKQAFSKKLQDLKIKKNRFYGYFLLAHSMKA